MIELPSALTAARALADRWPRRLSIAPNGNPMCIQSTRVAYEAFRLAGFLDVAPLSCDLVALNPAARVSIEQRRDIKGACRIEVGPDIDDDEIPEGRRTDSGWKGHLILEHPHFLLDLTLGAVIESLEATGFGQISAFCASKADEVELVDGVWTAMTADGCVIMHKPRPENDGWRSLAAWSNWDDNDAQAAEFVANVLTVASKRGLG